MQIQVGRFLLTFDDGVRYETYNEPPDFYGVKFYADGLIFDVLCNRHMGERFLINEERPLSGGFFRDMPFHLGTAGFLPDGIIVTC